MAHDDEHFRVRPGRVRDSSPRPRSVRPRPPSFLGEVHRAIRRAGGNPHRLAGKGKGSGRFNARGRGAAAAAKLKGRSGWSRDGSGARSRARRVMVKARVVRLNPQRGAARGRSFVSAKAVDSHLRYLERDGVTRDGEKGLAYSAEQDVEDGRAFLERGREDRHQFRFIVSAEEGAELSDLRTATRELMKQMETDLDTQLDWIAVDHHNTGHPHTHVIVRGVTDDGKTLNIAGDYIAHGVRERASEIVTLELGRQTEQEVSRSLGQEVDADRFTRLDRMLIAEQQSRSEFADLRPDKDTLETLRQNRALLIQRARKLERLGLASEVEAGRWTISPKAEATLRELGERGDTIESMHRALAREGLAERRSISTYAVHRRELTERIVGRVLDKGLGGDELGERVRLVVDGADGRVHHIEMDAAWAEDVGRGMIVSAGPDPSGPRAGDLNIQEVAGDSGVYRPSAHFNRARTAVERAGGDPEAFVRSHVRRLETLRRAGLVERIDDDHWRIPGDLSECGQAYDQAWAGSSIRVSVLSPTDLGQQVGHEGATWLDRELTSRQPTTLANEGFGLEAQGALSRRKQSLVNMGHITDLGDGRFGAPKDLIQRLEVAELERAGQALAAERGRQWKPTNPGEYVSGQLVGSAQLASGRFAMIDDGLGFRLVPWRPVLEQHLGRYISGIAMAGGGVDRSFARKLGLGI